MLIVDETKMSLVALSMTVEVPTLLQHHHHFFLLYDYTFAATDS
jgi:hypothetical protein